MNRVLNNKSFNIPNSLSVIRILIIPFFAYFYLIEEIIMATILITLSGISDALDGFIARKFNQITPLGKILDPFADKLTQVVLALCVGMKYSFLLPILLVFLFKEIAMIVMGSVLLKKKKNPGSAKWYGKISTVMFYISIIIIVIMSYTEMNETDFVVISLSLLGITAVLMLYSAIRYFAIFKVIINSNDEKYDFDLKDEIKLKKLSV